MNDFSAQDQLAHWGREARQAAAALAKADSHQKNQALLAIAQALREQEAAIIAANARDLAAGVAAGLDAASLDRLTLNPARVAAMIEGVRQVAALPDPCGAISDLQFRPSGIQVGKMRVPLGVIGIIYESRPNVTVDAASLCLKSGNATILRGGSESIHSNLAIEVAIKQGLAAANLPAAAVQVIPATDRNLVGALIRCDYVDVIVPRGGKSLIERISREATVPVIKHLDGICHVYIDDQADADKAMAIAINAKTHRYGVCNAMETLLVHEAIAPRLLPSLCEAFDAKGVALRVCEASASLLAQACPRLATQLATEDDWVTEYLAPILAIRLVPDLAAAITHINHFGSHHTDAIVTENYTRSRQFLRDVDSSSVVVNASTRFADGFEFGLGAEIGISTDKLHARGPVGLEGLTSQKWIVLGSGQVRV